NIRVIGAARFQKEYLCATVDVQICKRILHGTHVACLACKIEEIVLSLYKITHNVGISDV
ncbi:MAG: hypothetical protein WBK56_00475, partial [Methanoculleus sp.]